MRLSSKGVAQRNLGQQGYPFLSKRIIAENDGSGRVILKDQHMRMLRRIDRPLDEANAIRIEIIDKVDEVRCHGSPMVNIEEVRRVSLMMSIKSS